MYVGVISFRDPNITTWALLAKWNATGKVKDH